MSNLEIIKAQIENLSNRETLILFHYMNRQIRELEAKAEEKREELIQELLKIEGFSEEFLRAHIK